MERYTTEKVRRMSASTFNSAPLKGRIARNDPRPKRESRPNAHEGQAGAIMPTRTPLKLVAALQCTCRCTTKTTMLITMPERIASIPSVSCLESATALCAPKINEKKSLNEGVESRRGILEISGLKEKTKRAKKIESTQYPGLLYTLQSAFFMSFTA